MNTENMFCNGIPRFWWQVAELWDRTRFTEDPSLKLDPPPSVRNCRPFSCQIGGVGVKMVINMWGSIPIIN